MANHEAPDISFVLPVYNEAIGLPAFHESLMDSIGKLKLSSFEIIYVNDGSKDDSQEIIEKICSHNPSIKLLSLSRNFGKELATTAGIHVSTGQAIMMLDSDGQHPVELISEFLERWGAGSMVVVGVRTSNQKEGLLKHYGSKLFYKLFNRFTGVKLIPGSSDFRLIDRKIQQEFKRMTEHNRVTRGLIDWLGYDQDYIYYKANPRIEGEASYSISKLLKLAVDSVISLSTSPLYIVAYIGAFVLPVSVLLGLFMLIEMSIGDPLSLRLTGGAFIMVLMLFLIGILLLSQGIIGLYLSHIHSESQGRPLFIVDHSKSKGIDANL